MSKYSPLMTIIDAAARKAGRSLVRDFGEVAHLQVSKKGPADFVSAADKRADKILREELSRARPGFGFLTEEGADIKGDGEHRWIIDPLDGTTNFLHAVPHFAISIALEKAGEVVAAFVYNPVYDEIYWAEKGAGAFTARSGRLRVSARRDFSTCLIATGIPFMGAGAETDELPTFLNELTNVTKKSSGVRCTGAAALDFAYVAAGRFDAFWHRGLLSWDIAAGLLLVREAGGMVVDLLGQPATAHSPDILATNPQIAATMAELLLMPPITGLPNAKTAG
jgi:myo-inositol-1(or 4)-monophosphatase